MRDQIKYLSLSEKLTACQIAKQLHVSKKLVLKTLKEENSCLRYKFRIEYLGQGHTNSPAPIEGWFREIQIDGDMTLNGLNDCIQHVLGWDNTHCYIFTVHGKHYAYLCEEDDFTVEDVFENHCSTKIPLYLLRLCENDRVIYNSDFGDNHFFPLTVSAIESANESEFPMVTGARGKNLFQYEPHHYETDEEAPWSRSENAEFDVDKVNATLATALAIKRYDIWTIDFIVRKDKETLEQWRKSKDRRKWEIAVTILDNRSMSKDLISNKIERPIKKVQEWIQGFNYYGMESLSHAIARKKRTKDARDEKMEQRKKGVIEIIHHQPKFYNVNRSNWSLDSLAKVYNERFGESISRSLVSRSLKESKYTIKKARRVLTSPDPEYREKVEILLKTLNTLGPDELLFFIDELGPLKVRKYGGRIYSKVNEAPTYPQNQVGKGSISLAGALSATTNQVTWIFLHDPGGRGGSGHGDGESQGDQDGDRP
jgi:transposase